MKVSNAIGWTTCLLMATLVSSSSRRLRIRPGFHKVRCQGVLRAKNSRSLSATIFSFALEGSSPQAMLLAGHSSEI